MNTNVLSLVGQLSDQQLIAQVKLLSQREREATAALIAHLAVLDERGLYLAEGCSSLFTYCLQVLHLSEHAAYGRIEAARASRKYPIILELLGDGSVNLTTVTLLAPHLTPENHVNLLAAARHQRKRQVEELVATLRPLPSVPSSIRRLPAPKVTSAAAPGGAISSQAIADTAIADTVIGSQASGDASHSASVSLLSPLPSSPAPRAVVEPLAPERYKIQFTASAEMYEKLHLAQALLRHQIPDGDPAAIFDRALTVLVEVLAKQKHAATDRPRDRVHEQPPAEVSRSRHVPAQVKRVVWQRDGGKCAFVGTTGRRCDERGFLEFHHVVPYSEGGAASVDNIQLRCRAHNGYEFERAFGRGKMLEVREVSVAYGGSMEQLRTPTQISPATRSGPSSPDSTRAPGNDRGDGEGTDAFSPGAA